MKYLSAAIVLAVLILVACAAPPPVAMTEGDDALSVQLAPDSSLDIEARLELVAGIQAWTSWAAAGQEGDPGWFPSAYYRELKQFLAPYRTHPAFGLTQEMQDRGFMYDTVPELVLLSRHGLEFDLPEQGFPEHLIRRAGGEQQLRDLLAAWRSLARDCGFATFFNGHRDYYHQLASRLCRNLQARRISQWMQAFFGATGHQAFHYVLGPALTPGGGYGVSIQTTAGAETVHHLYQIVRQAEAVDGTYLGALGLHEFGHSFVNLGDQIPDSAKAALDATFAPVQSRMARMTYPNLDNWLNETVIRASEARGHLELGMLSATQVDDELAQGEKTGFTLIRTAYKALEEYAANRQLYPDFKSFGPVLLQRLADSRNRESKP